MRITVTLDPDVEQLLREAMQHRRLSFKEALNQVIRSGLLNAEGRGSDEMPFVVHARSMGLRAGIGSGRLNQMADEFEAEGFNELRRTLSQTLRQPAPRRRK